MIIHSLDIAARLSAKHSWQGEGFWHRDILRVSVDSRQIIEGGATLFFALVSPSGDGHRYLDEAYARGVRLFVVSEYHERYPERYPEALCLLVGDTLLALQSLAAWYRSSCGEVEVVAVIGSNGKTIVKEMLYRLLSPTLRGLYRSPESYNSQLGVALSLLGMPRGTRYAFIEAGISARGEMARLAKMIQPSEVIITHLGTAHSQHFGSLDELYSEKLQMLLAPSLRAVTTDAPPPMGDKIQSLMAELGLGDMLCLNAYGSRERSYALTLEGLEPTMASNLGLALYFIAQRLPEHYETALGQIGSLSPLPMRMELTDNVQGNLLINDSYTNDLDALSGAMLSLRGRGGDSIVLGPLEQSALKLGEALAAVHQMALSYGIKRIYLVDWAEPALLLIETAKLEGIEWYYAPDKDSLLREHQTALLETPVLLIKGARRSRLEELVQRLSRQEHDTKLEIDLSALRQNLAYYRSLLPREAGLICMIKADAYGLGAKAIAEVLQSSGHISHLAVAVADEGKALRREGIHCPIIVMNPQADSLKTLCRHSLEAEVYSLELLRAFTRLSTDETCPPLHLKVDSGMHRLGFRFEEVEAILDALRGHRLRIASVFSHLAGADEERLDDFSRRQAEYLQAFYTKLSRGLLDIGYDESELPRLHLLNTAGLERFSGQWAFDGARLGIGLYGFSPTGVDSVQAVVRLSTRILQVKDIAGGESVGYACRAYADQPRRIAVIPIGYADGLHRRLGNERWAVELRGQLAPIVGNICMDACMIDVSHIPEATAGDEVIVFGSEARPLEAIAAAGDTIAYEILTSISPRVARRYY